jgi:hypothetical protein
VPLATSWLPLSENHNNHANPPKNELFSQEMRLNILFLNRGLKLSNSKPGCRVSGLLFFVKYIYQQWLHDIELIQMSVFFFFFQHLILGLTPVSLLESELGLQIVTQPENTRIRPSLYLWSLVLLCSR